ncbi:MAG: amidohydrolase family protein [Planctomycetota bacterium]|nr:amidohydrolase family protein [Planctomycetota bacterium]
MNATHRIAIPAILAGFLMTVACVALPSGRTQEGQLAQEPGATSVFMIAGEEGAPAQFLIHKVTVIDVEAGRAIPAQTVRISEGKIDSILPASEQAAAGEMLIEFERGLYLIPGLFDTHVHFGMVPWKDQPTLGPLLIANGVTFVRDMGADTRAILALRDRVAGGDMFGPEMIVTGDPLRGPYKLGDRQPGVICETPCEGRRAVQKLAAKGVDQIKVHEGGLDAEVYRAILEESQKQGLKVVGHVPDPISLAEAVERGQASIEHLSPWIVLLNAWSNEYVKMARRNRPGASSMSWHLFGRELRIDPERWANLTRKMRESAISACPTLVLIERIRRVNDPKLKTDPNLIYVSTRLRARWNKARRGMEREMKKGEEGARISRWGELYPEMLPLVKRIHDSGVPLVCGTDFPVFYLVAGFSLHDEMELLQEAGLPPASVLQAATLNAARLCDVGDRLGTVTEGKTASLILLRENPLEDIRNTREIAGVFLRGEFYGRSDLDKLLDRVRARVR